jgi:adenylate kinase family enzyme
LARRIAELADLPHAPLDGLFWQPDWQETPPDEFREKVAKVAATDAWVMDGNYSRVQDLILSRATMLIWLNVSFPVAFWRAFSRTVRRVVTGQELWHGNRETFRNAFLSKDGIPAWVIRTYARHRRRYGELFAGLDRPDLELVELRTSRDVDAFLKKLEESAN